MLLRDRQPIFIEYISSIPNEWVITWNTLNQNGFADSALEASNF